MSSTIQQALQALQTAFETHVGTAKWRIKQLHNLNSLVQENRDEIYECIRKEINISQIQFELELEAFIQDIKQLLDHLGRSGSPNFLSSSSHVTLQPKGVSLILSQSRDPFRHGLSPLAASIAAGNCVVLVYLANELQPLSTLLIRRFKQYMDVEAFRLFQSDDFDEQELKSNLIKQTLVISDDPKIFRSVQNDKIFNRLPICGGINVNVVDRDCNASKVAATIKRNFGRRTFESNEPCLVLVDEVVKDNFISQVTLPDDDSETRHFILEKIPTDLRDLLKTVTKASDIPVFVTTSLDHSLNAMSALQKQVSLSQISVFSDSKANVRYLESFTHSNTFSVGEIVQRPPIVPRNSSCRATFPPEYFSTHRYAGLESQKLSPAQSVAQIRVRYSGLIKPLKKEPRGERIDFFVQMGWFIRGVKILMGLTSVGAICSVFWLGRRYLPKLLK